jgi:hypothetical protein
LGVRFRQQLQSSFDRGPLGPGSAAPHRLAHQPFIDVDIRPHGNASMCKNLMFMCISKAQ